MQWNAVSYKVPFHYKLYFFFPYKNIIYTVKWKYTGWTMYMFTVKYIVT